MGVAIGRRCRRSAGAGHFLETFARPADSSPRHARRGAVAVGRAVLIGAVFSMVVTTGFAINAAVTGELNYQGGERKIFYESYPFEHPGATFDNRGIG